MWRLSLSLFCNADEFEADKIYDDDIDDDSNHEHCDDDDVRVLLQNYLWRYHTSKTLPWLKNYLWRSNWRPSPAIAN